MKSDVPKVLHEIGGRPMIEFVLDAVRGAGVERTIVVVGFQADAVTKSLAHHTDLEFALQAEQQGTGHAVKMCAEQLAEHTGPVLVLSGDTPLLKGSSLAALLSEQKKHSAACVVGTAKTKANAGLGRIVRDDTSGEFLRIVEEKDATPEEQTIQEINTGCYAFDCRSLLAALSEIRPDNNQAEYYLTDCAAILKQQGRNVIASATLKMIEAMGVNTPDQLAEVERILANRTETTSV
jgi:bifunctional UDP-N-acetylglucosamine pyrophosphorylase/glucosamine-1-phosphate N-acetyltransferase